MIVTCEECSTSFQLDEARIPASGARVRCSRCKHAFFLSNPSASASQAVHAVVDDVVQGRVGRAPEPAQDLPRPPAGDRDARPGRSEPEEEDWEFSQEIRVAGDDEGEEPEVGGPSPRPDSFDLTGDFGHGFDPETFDRDAPETPRGGSGASKAPESDSARAREEATFGAVEDFSSMMEDEDLSIDVDTERTLPRSLPAAGRTPAGALRGGASSEDLGDPESWDLVGGDDSRHASSRVAALARPAAAPRKPALDLFEAAELPPIHDAAEPSGSWAAPQWAWVGHALGWGVALASLAAVASLLGHTEWSRWSPSPQRLEVGPLVASTTQVGWLETSRAGLLLVLEGELHNTGPGPMAPVPLQLRLLDGAGAPLPVPALEAGLPLADYVLREATPETLVAERSRAITQWAAQPLAPGETRRFVAISPAEALPSAAQRFLLEAGEGGRSTSGGAGVQRPSESLR